MDFVVARNPEEGSSLPFLLRLPLGRDGVALKVRETWPRTSKVYCHHADVWPEQLDIIERVPVRSCVRRGAAIDLVLDRAREHRSQFVFTHARGREVTSTPRRSKRASPTPNRSLPPNPPRPTSVVGPSRPASTCRRGAACDRSSGAPTGRRAEPPDHDHRERAMISENEEATGMGERLQGKVAVVVGGGQTAGETIGNGRATAIVYAREGARVVVVDRDLASAEETVASIRDDGGEAVAHAADITDVDSCASIPTAATSTYGALDVLHNNVGIGAGDQPATRVGEEAWQRIFDVNLSAMWRSCKVVMPVMRAAAGGAIVNISSIASICSTSTAAYQISKAGVNTLTQHLAMAGARHGIRVNAVLPGLINTPMAVEGISAARGIDREQLVAERNAAVPLGRAMGTAWDVAYAALFLASDEARFITGVLLPVDGGQSVRRG